MPSLKVLVRSMVLLPALAASGHLLAQQDGPPGVESHAEATIASRWAANYEITKSDYRLSLGRGALDVGIRFEARSGGILPPDSPRDRAGGGVPLAADLPSLSIGLRSTSIKSDGGASTLVDRAFGSGGEASVRKVGLAWKPAQSRVFLNQGLGFRFDDDDRLTVRLKKGSFGLYMQSTF
jgi:hypothetical protein